MTAAEQKTVDNLYKLLSEIQTANNTFRRDVTEKVEKIQKQVDATYLPVNLEQEVLRAAQQSIAESIKSVLTCYSSPLSKFVIAAVEQNSEFLKELISSCFDKVIREEDFKQAIISGFSHKVARTLIGNHDGLFDKVSNSLKQDTIFKSKMALAVSNVVEECLKLKEKNNEKIN